VGFVQHAPWQVNVLLDIVIVESVLPAL